MAASSAHARSFGAADRKYAPSTREAAPEVDECPLTYAGKGGVAMYERKFGSNSRRIAVTGRSVQ
jgi:hypothetical protein